MASIGKSLTFEPTEIDELLELKYGGQRTFPVLALLYPGLDFSKQFHEDHIFPRSRFTTKKLNDAGVPVDQTDRFVAARDLLPNLQLLGGIANVEKRAKLPADWLSTAFGSDEKRATYAAENDLVGLLFGIQDFMTFYEQRKARMRDRLLQSLGVQGAESVTEEL